MTLPKDNISILLISINTCGIVGGLLYGIYGGSGGETTETAFLILAFACLASLLLGIAVALVRFSWWRSNYMWAVFILLINLPATAIIMPNFVHNAFKQEKKPQTTGFGIVPLQQYLSDKKQVEDFLKQKGKENHSADTLFYSKSLSKIFVIGSVADSTLNTHTHYRSFVLFARVEDTGLSVSFPAHGGTFYSTDTDSRENLLEKTLKGYINTYSVDEEDEKGLWQYEDFWK